MGLLEKAARERETVAASDRPSGLLAMSQKKKADSPEPGAVEPREAPAPRLNPQAADDRAFTVVAARIRSLTHPFLAPYQAFEELAALGIPVGLYRFRGRALEPVILDRGMPEASIPDAAFPEHVSSRRVKTADLGPAFPSAASGPTMDATWNKDAGFLFMHGAVDDALEEAEEAVLETAAGPRKGHWVDPGAPPREIRPEMFMTDPHSGSSRLVAVALVDLSPAMAWMRRHCPDLRPWPAMLELAGFAASALSTTGTVCMGAGSRLIAARYSTTVESDPELFAAALLQALSRLIGIPAGDRPRLLSAASFALADQGTANGIASFIAAAR